MTQIDIRDENLFKLRKIQKVIKAEDGVNSSLDESLARVLDFYRMFVPYN
jgi:histidyl-tRNA synthetase